MTPIDLLRSQRGRIIRVVAGLSAITLGLRRGDGRGRAVAMAGVVPLAAGLADVCVLGPLVGGPLGGESFRRHRADG